MRLPWLNGGAALSLFLAGVMPGLTGAETVLQRPDPLNTKYLAVFDATKTWMRSGFDYNDGNYDSGNLVRIEPVQTAFSNAASAWVLLEVDGPGVVTSIWFTGKNKKGEAYIGGRLNFFIDGHPSPAIAGELPALFTNGQVFPPGLAEQSSGAWVCYAPVYFARSIKVTLTEHGDAYTHRKNAHGDLIPHLYHQFTWQRLQAPVTPSRLGDARWREWVRDTDGRAQTNAWDLAAGGPVTVFSAKGAGVLKQLKLHWPKGEPDECALRVRADGNVAVDLTVPRFWGFSRKARPTARFQSLVLGVADDGGYYCAFPMPHRRELAVELTGARAAARVVVETVHATNAPTGEVLHFHAGLVTNTTERGRDIRLLETKGRGHFVGTILELADGTLEGDDRFYIDGEPFPPAWHGTGTEDYFRCGWYFHGGPITRPLYGLLDAAKPKIAYRFHVADRLNYTTSAVIGFEHGHGNRFMGPFKGVVFWYADR